MAMEIMTLSVDVGTNCYIVWDKQSYNAVVIDPGYQGKRIAKVLVSNSLQLQYIFLTHAHYDHISGIDDLIISLGYDCPIYVSKKDMEVGDFPFRPITFEGKRIRYWEEFPSVIVGSMSFQVRLTPGHSPGSVCLIVESSLFCGDVLCKGSIGRTDFLGGSEYDMIQSLKYIASLQGDYQIYPGHGEITTLLMEQKCNPFLKAVKTHS